MSRPASISTTTCSTAGATRAPRSSAPSSAARPSAEPRATFTFFDPIDGELASRDTDWYKLELTESKFVTFEAEGDFPIIVGIVNNFGIDSCAGVDSFLDFQTAGECETASVTAELSAGTWYLFVSVEDFFSGVECGATYRATVSGCEDPPTGAVCLPDGTCQDGLTESEANALGGDYQGDDTNCGDITCPVGAVCLPDGTCVDGLTEEQADELGGFYQGDFTTCNDVECPLPPDNDDCANAEPLSVPSLTFGSTLLAATDDAPTCGTTNTAPGVWYSIDGTGTTVTASLCGETTQYDSKISVFCGDCSVLNCVTGNDDFCGLQSEVSFCTEVGATYLILVHGFSSSVGDFELEITEDGVECLGAVACLPRGACCGAELTTCTHTVEMFDSFGDGWNGAQMDVLVNGSVVLSGISASGSGSSETFTAETGDVITTVYSTGSFESENSYQILDGFGNVIASDGPSPGAGVTATGNCPPPDDCNVLTEEQCHALGGTYLGDGVPCPTIIYDIDLAFDGVIDISGSGTPLGLGDDDGVVLPLGFTFNFYGNDYTQIGISSNGYLTFGSDLTDLSNDPIPGSQ